MFTHKPKIIFFGSFLEYSVQILTALHQSDQVEVIGVVTTPPRPAGRKQILTPTPVHTYAMDHGIPAYTPEKLTQTSLQLLSHHAAIINHHPDLFVVAGYGKLLPKSWLSFPKIAPVNIHFSLLPKYRGAMPGEWALLMDETETGVSLIEMSPRLDEGNIYAQASSDIKPDETRESLYTELYDLGGRLFLDTLSRYLEYKVGRHSELRPEETGDSESLPKITQITDQVRDNAVIFLPPQPQPTKTEQLYARLLDKQDSYVPWELIDLAVKGQSASIDQLTPLLQELPAKILTQSGLAEAIERMTRALAGWPGVWTEVKTDKGTKRLKLLSVRVTQGKLKLDQVQLEGKTPSSFDQIQDVLV